MSRTDRAQWLAGLRPAIQEWIGQQCRRQHQRCVRSKRTGKVDPEPSNESCTQAYGDLTLAFGLAWLGAADECRRLVEEARRKLEPTWDDARAYASQPA